MLNKARLLPYGKQQILPFSRRRSTLSIATRLRIMTPSQRLIKRITKSRPMQLSAIRFNTGARSSEANPWVHEGRQCNVSRKGIWFRTAQSCSSNYGGPKSWAWMSSGAKSASQVCSWRYVLRRRSGNRITSWSNADTSTSPALPSDGKHSALRSPGRSSNT